MRYSTAIREIEAAILELKLKVIQLQEAIDVTSAGQLSSVLIHPYNLSIILQQVSLQLPAGLSMLTVNSTGYVRVLCYCGRTRCCYSPEH